MAINEYRLNAAECLCIADEMADPKRKMLLIAMAQAWLKMAQEAEQETAANPSQRVSTLNLQPRQP
jgi:hypothetical protein